MVFVRLIMNKQQIWTLFTCNTMKSKASSFNESHSTAIAFLLQEFASSGSILLQPLCTATNADLIDAINFLTVWSLTMDLQLLTSNIISLSFSVDLTDSMQVTGTQLFQMCITLGYITFRSTKCHQLQSTTLVISVTNSDKDIIVKQIKQHARK